MASKPRGNSHNFSRHALFLGIILNSVQSLRAKLAELRKKYDAALLIIANRSGRLLLVVQQRSSASIFSITNVSFCAEVFLLLLKSDLSFRQAQLCRWEDADSG